MPYYKSPWTSEDATVYATFNPEHRLVLALCGVLEWAKGNRGPKDGNPYCVDEIKTALQVLAQRQGCKDFFDANTVNPLLVEAQAKGN